MSFGEASPDFHQWTLGPEDTEHVIGHAFEQGINFIDTANCYSFGTSEEYIGRALKRLDIPRDRVVLASKVYFNDGKLSADAIRKEIDGTLRRLGTDYLDLYIIHRFDYDTPMEETMEALDGLVRAGKVRAPRCERNVRLPVPQPAACRRTERLDEVHEHAVPLQPALPRRRTRAHARVSPVRCCAHAVPARSHPAIVARATWDSDSVRSTTDATMRNKYDAARAVDLPVIERVAQVASKYGVPMGAHRSCMAVGTGRRISHRRVFEHRARRRGSCCA